MKLVCGITAKNEEWIIGKTLSILTTFCDKVIVLDDNSSDNTVEICKTFNNVKVYNRKPRKEIYMREESKGLYELFTLVGKENPDYILMLDADEIPTPSFLTFLKNIDKTINAWSVRFINLYKDGKHYRKDNFTTKTGINIRHDPFYNDGWRKTILVKYDKNYNYTYDFSVQKGGTSKYHPSPKNIQQPVCKTEDFYVIHYGKINPTYMNGDKDKFYSLIESNNGKGTYEQRLLHHYSCRTGHGINGPEYMKCPEEWFWKYVNNNYNSVNIEKNSKIPFHPYYDKCISNYENINKLGINGNNIYNFDYKIINKDTFNKFFCNVNYNEYINVIDELGNLFNGNNEELAIIRHRQPIMTRIKKQVLTQNTELINKLYNLILPNIEKNLFNSAIQISDMCMYRNTINNMDVGISSWLWHFDDHPNEFIKIIIYLNDVDENSSPFQFLIDNNDNAIKLVGNKMYKEDFVPDTTIQYFNYQGENGANRFHEKDINELYSKGFKDKKVYGKKGTIILFSENIIHKATYPKNKERIVFRSVLSPSMKKREKYLKWDEFNKKGGYEKWLDN